MKLKSFEVFFQLQTSKFGTENFIV